MKLKSNNKYLDNKMFQLNFLKLVVIFIRALYQFVAGAEDELSLQVGAEVTVLRQGDYEGWLLGQIAGTKGIFPESYVERFEKETEEEIEEDKSEAEQEENEVKEEMRENTADKDVDEEDVVQEERKSSEEKEKTSEEDNSTATESEDEGDTETKALKTGKKMTT